MTNWEIRTKIEKIIDDNCESIPYEGMEIDKWSITQEIIGFIKELSYSDLEEIQKMEI